MITLHFAYFINAFSSVDRASPSGRESGQREHRVLTHLTSAWAKARPSAGWQRS